MTALGRRRFLGCTLGGAALAVVGDRGAAAGTGAQEIDSPYGPLSAAADANGLLLPAGFTSRIVARSLLPVAGTGHLWHIFPDGGATFPTDDGGWIYVSNSESPPPVADLPLPPGDLPEVLLGLGGVGAIRFAADGSIVDAYAVLTGSRTNCAGGATPWGTWLSCEEWEAAEVPGLFPYDAGLVWECDPFTGSSVPRAAMGRFVHEMAAPDTVGQTVYLTEDKPNGLFYRFTPHTWGDLSEGDLEAAAVDPASGAVTWVPVADAATPTAPLRESTPGATPFNGGEGCVYDRGHVYVTTKGDDRVWVHDIAAQTMTVLYDGPASGGPLDGVDNIIASPLSHDLYVAEDGGNLEVCIITPEGLVAPVVRMTGIEHGAAIGPLPTESEVTGLALSPDGTRLYFSSERGAGLGITYEVTGPFRGSALAPPPEPAPTAGAPPPGAHADAADRARETATAGVTATTPRTGTDALGWAGAGAMAAGAALWRLRTRVTRPRP